MVYSTQSLTGYAVQDVMILRLSAYLHSEYAGGSVELCRRKQINSRTRPQKVPELKAGLRGDRPLACLALF
jgi:hypothetical protein